MTPAEHRATAEGLCIAAAANLTERSDIAGVQASLANTHARLAALPEPVAVRERPRCPEASIDGLRCTLAPDHREQCVMGSA